MAERRVILLGKTGNGKSSTGNSILEDEIFKSESSPNSVTSICEVQKRTRRDNRDFKVCDTPGLFCSGEDPIEIALKIQKSVELCQKPHAFLLVFAGVNRMTTDEKYTIDLLRIIFGDKMFDHCIVVFTRGNAFKTDSDFDAFWKKSPELKTIVEKCDYRVVKIENDKACPENTGLESLLEMIEKMASKGTYKYRYLKDHSEVLQKYKQKYGVSKPEDMDKHLNKILDKLSKRLEKKERLVDEERKQQEDLRSLSITLKNRLEDNEKTIENLKRKIENNNSNNGILHNLAYGATRAVLEGTKYVSKLNTQSSASSGRALPDSSSLGGGLPGSSSFGGGLPGSSSFGRF